MFRVWLTGIHAVRRRRGVRTAMGDPENPDKLKSPDAARPALTRRHRFTLLVLGIAVVCLLLVFVFLLLQEQVSESDQFKSLAAKKEAKLKSLLANRGSELLEYSSEVTEQKVVARKE